MPNPFFGQITVGSLAGRTVPRAQLLRPYPHFDGVASQGSTWATSSYHALMARAEKRYASGLNMLVSYTYSKYMDYGTGPFGGETVGASKPSRTGMTSPPNGVSRSSTRRTGS